MVPVERPENSERPTLEAVARALRSLLFAIGLLLGLAFALICYAEIFGLVQFDYPVTTVRCKRSWPYESRSEDIASCNSQKGG
jgi:hypothetical protein